MKRFVLILHVFILAVLVSRESLAQQYTIGFDDVSGGQIPIYDGYNGFNWKSINNENLYVVDGISYQNTGYAQGTISPRNVLFNPYGYSPSSITKVSGSFNFESVYLTSAWFNQQVRFEGYKDGTLKFSSPWIEINTLTPRLISLGWADIDQLVIHNTGTHWAIDNFTYSLPAPCTNPVASFDAASSCFGDATSLINTSTNLAADATYAWDVDNDGDTDYTTKDVSHTYATAGTHTAKLTVIQGTCSDFYTKQVTINTLPTPALSSSDADNAICAGQGVTFTAGGGAEYEFFIDNVSQGTASSTNTLTTSSLTNGQSVTVKVTNAAGCIKSSSGIITTVNSLPVPTLASSDVDNIICVGDVVTFTAGGGSNYAFYLNGVEVQAASSDNTWASSALNNLDAVKVIVISGTGCSKESESIITTVKTLPTATLSGGGTICPSASANLSVALTGTGPWSVTYTDGTAPVTVNNISASPHLIAVSPASTKTYSLVCVSDVNCNATSLSGTALVTVNSVPVLTVPTIASVGNDANSCGASVTFAATATGSPTPTISYTLNGSSITSPHVFPVGTSTVTATATNSCGTDIETFDVTVTNVAPVISAVTPGTIYPIPINTPFSASAAVTDNNLQSGTWTWDDGTTSAGVISGSTISGNRTYNSTGVYTIGLNVKDACNSTDQSNYQYVVVYDPSGGFVTGGGWITSPQNAQLYYMQESGRANFGFVSKYVKGATKPTGETNFEFQTANLHFQSSNYEWLVVSGATARYKGVGTINGSGNYGFILSAIDGQVTGGGGTDKFRIKIWDKNNNDVVVYDNNLSATGDDALAETIISGGSIVVHEAKKATSSKTVVAATEPQRAQFYSYPTAFSDKTTIAFTLDKAENYVVEVFDMKGALVKKLAAGNAEANKLYEVELDGTGMREGVYITRLSTSSNVRSLKTVLRR